MAMNVPEEGTRRYCKIFSLLNVVGDELVAKCIKRQSNANSFSKLRETVFFIHAPIHVKEILEAIDDLNNKICNENTMTLDEEDFDDNFGDLSDWFKTLAYWISPEFPTDVQRQLRYYRKMEVTSATVEGIQQKLDYLGKNVEQRFENRTAADSNHELIYKQPKIERQQLIKTYKNDFSIKNEEFQECKHELSRVIVRARRSPKVVVIGPPGVGKSSLINLFCNVCSSFARRKRWRQYVTTGKYNTDRQVTQILSRLLPIDYNMDEKGECYPHFIDMEGMPDENIKRLEAVLKHLFSNHIQENRNLRTLLDSIPVSDNFEEHLQEELAGVEGLEVDQVLVVASADEPLPKSLIDCVVEAAKNARSNDGSQRKILPVLGVLTKTDEIKSTNEIDSIYKQFKEMIGEQGNTEIIVNYTEEDVDILNKSLREHEGKIPQKDIPVLQLLTKLYDKANYPKYMPLDLLKRTRSHNVQEKQEKDRDRVQVEERTLYGFIALSILLKFIVFVVIVLNYLNTGTELESLFDDACQGSNYNTTEDMFNNISNPSNDVCIENKSIKSIPYQLSTYFFVLLMAFELVFGVFTPMITRKMRNFNIDLPTNSIRFPLLLLLVKNIILILFSHLIAHIFLPYHFNDFTMTQICHEHNDHYSSEGTWDVCWKKNKLNIIPIEYFNFLSYVAGGLDLGFQMTGLLALRFLSMKFNGFMK